MKFAILSLVLAACALAVPQGEAAPNDAAAAPGGVPPPPPVWNYKPDDFYNADTFVEEPKEE